MGVLLGKANNHDLASAAEYVCRSAAMSPDSLVRGHFANPYLVSEVEPQHDITQFVHLQAANSTTRSRRR
ncbi:hypothetical protein [Amycolatopsis sp. NPDC051903]|uniref:hypothetical protein n=1 Tax=Amycolatopsis sp. NPDC051903 TaxID=3363936 RepID=UPI0037984152